VSCRIDVAERAHEPLRLELIRRGALAFRAGEQAEADGAALAGLVEFCREQLLPHLEHDEQWLTRAGGCPEGRLLATAMRSEARALAAAVHELATATDRCDAMGAARVVHALFAAHVDHARLLASVAGGESHP
jgi:hypothetical protein